MNYLKIIKDYKDNIPLQLIARKNDVSLHQVIKILHYKFRQEQQEIEISKRILDD
jgi:hypothetical protein